MTYSIKKQTNLKYYFLDHFPYIKKGLIHKESVPSIIFSI